MEGLGGRVHVGAHRRVVAINGTPIDLHARGECFGEEELVGEKAGHVHKTFESGITARAGEGHLKVADGRRKEGGKARHAAHVCRARDIGIRHLQHLVH